MNDTSATSQPGSSLLPDGTGAITTIHFVLLLLVAIAAVAIIVVGIRRKRLRNEAARQVERNAEEAGVSAPAATPTPAPVSGSPSPAPAPVAPPPPPLADETIAPDLPAPDVLVDEPIAAAAPMEASPATVAADPAPVLEGSAADGPVTQLKGLGPKVAARLAELGVTRVGQIAALDDEGAAALDAELGSFRGRLTRDRWVEQARFLAAGNRAGFEAVFGRL